MKNTPPQTDLMKRKLLGLLAVLPVILAACFEPGRPGLISYEKNLAAEIAAMNPADKKLRERFHGMHGLVLRLDATSPKHGVTISNETGRLSTPVTLDPENVGTQIYTNNAMPIPKTVSATWREGDFKRNEGGPWVGGTIIGDYTVPVAERIPDSILDYIRKNGGALRLKIRLKDDGILIGWDVEERVPLDTPGAGNHLRYAMPGGDFQEAKIVNGEVVRKGWYINKSGQKMETNW